MSQAMDSLRLTPACLGIGGQQPDNGPLERRADQLGRGIFRFDRRHCHGCGPERLRRVRTSLSLSGGGKAGGFRSAFFARRWTLTFIASQVGSRRKPV